MKKREELIPVKQALEHAFDLGVHLGFSLGGLGSRIAPRITPKKGEKEVAAIIRKEIDTVFKEFGKETFEKVGTELKEQSMK